ncbi:two-component sensor and regulator domain protein [Mycobacterium kansasii 732]|nr:two-component sensor and regulator domain protein [Mycobacterium kansasii 732]
MSEPAPPSTSGRRQLPDDLAAAVPLGGEMGRRFAEFDWAVHPLGPPPTGHPRFVRRWRWL